MEFQSVDCRWQNNADIKLRSKSTEQVEFERKSNPVDEATVYPKNAAGAGSKLCRKAEVEGKSNSISAIDILSETVHT